MTSDDLLAEDDKMLRCTLTKAGVSNIQPVVQVWPAWLFSLAYLMNFGNKKNTQ